MHGLACLYGVHRGAAMAWRSMGWHSMACPWHSMACPWHSMPMEDACPWHSVPYPLPCLPLPCLPLALA